MGLLDILAMSSDLAGTGINAVPTSTSSNSPSWVQSKLDEINYDPRKATSADQEQENHRAYGSVFSDAINSGIDPENAFGYTQAQKSNILNYLNDKSSGYNKNKHYNKNYDPEANKWKGENAKGVNWEGFSDEATPLDPFSGSYMATPNGLNSLYYDANLNSGAEPLPRSFNTPTQMSEYYNWISTTDEGQWFAENFPEYADLEYGYSLLRSMQDRDAYGYLLGLQGGDNKGIDSWRKRYSNSGVAFTDEEGNPLDNELVLDAVMQWMDENRADYGAFMRGDNSINIGNDSDARSQMINLLMRDYGYGFSDEIMNAAGLDENDARLFALMSIAQAEDYMPLASDINEWNKNWAKAGGKGEFEIVPYYSPEYEMATINEADPENNKLYTSRLDANEFNPAEIASQGYYDDQPMAQAYINAFNSNPNNSGYKLVYNR